MSNPLQMPLRLVQICVIVLATSVLTVTAQVPNTLLHSIPSPTQGLQTGGQLGYSVGIDGPYTVAGVPYDDTRARDSGLVKIVESTTGTLLFTLVNPVVNNANFGWSVAISGTRVVIGSPSYNTGLFHVGRAYVYDLSGPNPSEPVFTLENPTPAVNDGFGISVAISGTRVVIAASSDDTGATDAGSAYVYDLGGPTPTTPAATLNNPSPAPNDGFGRSVGISGASVVVSASGDDVAGTDVGAVYVYDVTNVTPSAPKFVLFPDQPAGGQFGASVMIEGTRIVIGYPGHYSGATGAGSAYIYDLAGASPSVPLYVLDNPTPAFTDSFGFSVAISGTRVVVGAKDDDTGATNAGSAYVYDLSGPEPNVPTLTFNNPGTATNDRFGWSVGISGTRIVAGASLDDMGATDAGSAYLYDLSSAIPTQPTSVLNDPGSPPNENFGCSVAVSGARMVAGAYQNNTGAYSAGSAYVFDLSNGTPATPILTLYNPAPAQYDWFGFSVAISGTRVVVGTPEDSTGASIAGSVYVYDLNGTIPSVPTITINNPSPASSDYFGWSVAISDTMVVAGARLDDTGATDAGAAYVYDVNGANPGVPVFTLNNPAPDAGDSFGFAVAIAGSLVVVGARGDDAGATDAGSAYVYDLSGPTPTVPIATLNKPNAAVSDAFGGSVAISGTRVVVGASGDDTGATNAGSAYVYDMSSATPATQVATLNNPAPSTDDIFGGVVAISGTRIVIGSCFDDFGATNSGNAYVYDISSASPTVPVATLRNPDPAVSDSFGDEVAIDGTTVVIGTPFDDAAGYDRGAAYVFGVNPQDQDSDGLPDFWELTYWQSTTGHGALDDSDHDGVCELLELAFGLNPTLPSASGMPAAIDEGGYLTMTITKQAGVTYEVQSAGTLVPAQPYSFSGSSTTVLTDTSSALKVRDNLPMTVAGSRFMRVKVTAAP